MRRKLANIVLTVQALEDLFKGDRTIEIVRGLPEDARLVGGVYEPVFATWIFTFESEQFNPVYDSGAVPVNGIEIKIIRKEKEMGGLEL